jgi:hypothetical protein
MFDFKPFLKGNKRISNRKITLKSSEINEITEIANSRNQFVSLAFSVKYSRSDLTDRIADIYRSWLRTRLPICILCHIFKRKHHWDIFHDHRILYESMFEIWFHLLVVDVVRVVLVEEVEARLIDMSILNKCFKSFFLTCRCWTRGWCGTYR